MGVRNVGSASGLAGEPCGKRERQQQVAVTGSSSLSEADWNASHSRCESSERDGFPRPGVTGLLGALTAPGMGSPPCPESSLPTPQG